MCVCVCAPNHWKQPTHMLAWMLVVSNDLGHALLDSAFAPCHGAPCRLHRVVRHARFYRPRSVVGNRPGLVARWRYQSGPVAHRPRLTPTFSAPPPPRPSQKAPRCSSHSERSGRSPRRPGASACPPVASEGAATVGAFLPLLLDGATEGAVATSFLPASLRAMASGEW